ncbi:MAG: saccharopine dehydrogenase NADP-binding domain-containing protein [Melioribacteraceae bacterium]
MNNLDPRLMVYGANGYSAQLIIEELIARKINPVLAGRNKEEVSSLAQKYNLEFKIFDLSDEKEILVSLEGIHTLINCAGPFKYTAKELMEACLQSKTNYLDITGEMPVMHLAFSMIDNAREKGVVIMPGVGFDIIPTDCLAKRLSERMPDADNLKLGFLNKRGKISRGTMITTLEFLGGTGKIRRNGRVIDSKIGEFRVKFKRGNFSFKGISIPWGDVYSSYHSTGIKNAEVYLALPGVIIKLRTILLFALRLLKIDSVKNIVKNYIGKNLTGPAKGERDSAETYIWGRVESKDGRKIEEIYRVMEGYTLTAKGAAECSERVLNNEVCPGTYTPSLAFGSGFLEHFIIEKIYSSAGDI